VLKRPSFKPYKP